MKHLSFGIRMLTRCSSQEYWGQCLAGSFGGVLSSQRVTEELIKVG